ncbi:hypothetical protein EDB85DRAFT_1887002 [Lactarius pseudohatsudake]|nr:hypothetical protein EDB85DRAFT_1887002 [Lactarius pseudohatsudake]
MSAGMKTLTTAKKTTIVFKSATTTADDDTATQRLRQQHGPDPRAPPMTAVQGFGQTPRTEPRVRFGVQPKGSKNRTEPNFPITTLKPAPYECKITPQFGEVVSILAAEEELLKT